MIPDQQQQTDRPEPPRIEWVRVVGGALAAISSAFLLSTLGAAGTIIGAALGSVIVSVGTSLYAQGLTKSRQRMADAQTMAMRRVGVAQAEVRRASRRRGAGSKAHLEHADEELAAAKDELDEAERTRSETWRAWLREVSWRKVALWAGGLFLIAVVLITAFELIIGKPISTLTGGTKGGGTSFSRVDHGAPAQHTPTPTPSHAPTSGTTPSPTLGPVTPVPSTLPTTPNPSAPSSSLPTSIAPSVAPSQ